MTAEDPPLLHPGPVPRPTSKTSWAIGEAIGDAYALSPLPQHAELVPLRIREHHPRLVPPLPDVQGVSSHKQLLLGFQ